MAKKEKAGNLTLSIKQVHFDAILAGTKTFEERQIWPTNVRKHCEMDGGWSVTDERGEPVPRPYGTITFLTGAYRGTRPRMVVEVTGAAIRAVTYAEAAAAGAGIAVPEGEGPEDVVTYEYDDGETYPLLAVRYELGRIIERPAGARKEN